MLVDSYLENLFEFRHSRGSVPAPTLAWELIHGKKMPYWRGGKYPNSHALKNWEGIIVDKEIKTNWLKGLKKIPSVEIRSTCAGHGPKDGDSKEWCTYVVFRVEPDMDKQIPEIVKKLKKEGLMATYDVGTEGRPRCLVAAPLYYGCKDHKEWVKWWSELPKKINKAVNG